MKKRLLHYFGVILVLLCLAILGFRISDILGDLGERLFQRNTLLLALALSGIYAASCFLLAFAWTRLIRGVQAQDRMPLVRIYGVTSIAKYIPGNLFHIAGRQIAAVQRGLSHGRVAVASTLELLLCLGVAASIVYALATLSPGSFELPFSGTVRLVAAGLAVVFILVVYWQRSRLLSLAFVQAISSNSPDRKSFLFAIVMYASFFAVSAGITAVFSWPLEISGQYVLVIGIAYIVSWIAGFVTPGASGGLGVREATLVILLSPLLDEVTAMTLAILMRMVTTLGDGVFFLASLSLAHDGDARK